MLLTNVFVCTGVEPPIFLLNQYACPNYSFPPFSAQKYSIFMRPPKKKKIRNFYYVLQPDLPSPMGYFFMLPKTFIFLTPPPPKLRYKSILSFKKSDLSVSCPNIITVKLDESETVVKRRKKAERKS